MAGNLRTFEIEAQTYSMIKTLPLLVIVLSCLAGFTTYAAGGVHTIHVGKSAFEPKSISAVEGDTIKWVLDKGAHNIKSGTIPDGAIAFQFALNKNNSTVTRAVTKAGTYNYYCGRQHLLMKGTITVAPDTSAHTKTDVASVVLTKPEKTETPAPEKNETDTVPHIYPQPFRTTLNIDLSNTGLFKNPVSVEVYDALGTMKYNLTDENPKNPIALNLEKLPAGYYIVNVSDKTTRRTYRVVKSE